MTAEPVAGSTTPPSPAGVTLRVHQVEALGAHHKAEIDKWWPIIKAAGIKAE